MDFKSLLSPISFSGRPRADEVPTPTRTRSRNRRLAALREAREIIHHLPGEEGETTRIIMTGRCDLADYVEVLLDRLGEVDHLRIATLSFNRRNVDAMSRWVSSGRVRQLTILYSHFFEHHNPEIIEELRQSIPTAHFAAARNHCKIITFAFTSGRRLSLEGSANLRSNANREQLAITDDQSLHGWFSEYIDAQVAQYAGGTSP